MKEPTLSAVRFSADGERRGWCGHKHRIRDQAEMCARRLNAWWSRSSAHAGEYWQVKNDGHLPTSDAPTGYIP